MLPAHPKNLVTQPPLVVGSESAHVNGIVADDGRNLVGDLRRVRIGMLRVRGEETADAHAVDGTRRVRGRHADDRDAVGGAGSVRRRSGAAQSRPMISSRIVTSKRRLYVSPAATNN